MQAAETEKSGERPLSDNASASPA